MQTRFQIPPAFALGGIGTSIRTYVILCLLGLAAVRLEAAVVTEDFSEYSQAKLEGQTGGAGLSGDWLGNTYNNVVSGDLNGPAASASLIRPQTGTAQSLQTIFDLAKSGYTDSQTRIALSTPFTGVTWISFVAQVSGNHRLSLGLNAIGTGTDNNDMNIFLSKSGNVVQVRKSSSTVFSDTVSSSLTNFFIVARMDPTATIDNVDLWINPTSSSAFFSTPDIADADVPFTGSVITNFSVGGYNAVSGIDNIRLGTSLGDVTTVVPEPGTLAMLLLGLVSIFGIRRAMDRSRSPISLCPISERHSTELSGSIV